MVSTGYAPKVPYLERQFFLEWSEQVAALYDCGPLPVTLVQMDDKDKIVGAWKTDSVEWLPHRFAPLNLGMENELKSSIEKLL